MKKIFYCIMDHFILIINITILINNILYFFYKFYDNISMKWPRISQQLFLMILLSKESVNLKILFNHIISNIFNINFLE